MTVTLIDDQSRPLDGASLVELAELVLIDQGFDAVLSLDADGQHLPREIPKFVEAFRETRPDLIIGDRSHLWGGMVPRRRNANRFSAWSISKCAGVRVPDSQSGFRVYSNDMLRAIPIRAPCPRRPRDAPCPAS